jgi:ABC-type polysaccharide/polyol phosphate transport system ATPase subunit
MGSLPKNEPAVIVDKVQKVYRLYETPVHRLKQALWRGKRHYFRDFTALSDVNLRVEAGATLGIIGLNGSGKSTLLQIIAGVLQPTAGVVKVKGRLTALLELGAGFNAEYTGRENVLVNGAILGLMRYDVDRLIPQIMDFAGIGEFFDQPLKTYSSGMIVRLAFAVATSVNPEVLLIDEALAVGDAPFQMKCFQRFREFQDAGKTIIFVSHDIGAVQQLCDQGLLLDHGRIMAFGDPKEVSQEYTKIVRLSSKEMNIKVSEAGKRVMRMGTKEMEILGSSLNGSENGDGITLNYGEKVCLSMKVKFNREIDRPIVGCLVKMMNRFEVAGANNFYEGHALRPHKGGEVADYEISFPMLLSPNTYYLSLGVAYEDDGIVRADYIECAFIFRSLSRRPIPCGIVDLDMEIKEI